MVDKDLTIDLMQRFEREVTLTPSNNILLNTEQIEQCIPHRDPFLWINKITTIDDENKLIQGILNLTIQNPIFKGHFPGNPIFPGVLQVEAIGQNTAILFAKLNKNSEEIPAIIEIKAAKFLQKIQPDCEVYINSTLIEDGLFFISAGQILQNGTICSCAVLKGLYL